MYRQIGQMVYHHRKKLGLSRQALAETAGVGKTVIFDIENGKATVKLQTLIKIFKILDIQLVFRTPTIDVAFKEEA